MKIEIFTRKPPKGRLQWYFRIVGGNGEIVSPSEGYNRHQSAMKTIRSLQRDIADAEIVEVINDLRDEGDSI